MKIPDKVKIGGKEYLVTFERNLVQDNGLISMGSANSARQIIKLNNSYPQEGIESTFLHEILVIITSAYELGLEHRQISVLEETLYQVLKENNICFG